MTIDNYFDSLPQRQKKQCVPFPLALNLLATCIGPNPTTCPRSKTSSLQATQFYKNTRNAVNDGIQWNVLFQSVQKIKMHVTLNGTNDVDVKNYIYWVGRGEMSTNALNTDFVQSKSA